MFSGAVCWFWDQCWGYPTRQKKQNGAFIEPGFPGKLCQSGKGFLVFYFESTERQHSQETEQLCMIFLNHL